MGARRDAPGVARVTPGVAAALVVATVLLSGPGGRRRLRPPKRSRRRLPRPALAIAAVAATGGTLLLGPVGVLVSALGLGFALNQRRRRASRPLGSDLALSLDVMAGCLAAGASMHSALEAARVAAPAQVARAFAAAAAGLTRGEDPDSVWLQVCTDVPELDTVGRLCARAAATGAPVAAELHRIASAHRLSLVTSQRRRLQRASVWLVLPLGLCFLPAFVLVGVVPLVAGALPAMSR